MSNYLSFESTVSVIEILRSYSNETAGDNSVTHLVSVIEILRSYSNQRQSLSSLHAYGFQWSKSYVATPTWMLEPEIAFAKVSVIEILRSYSNWLELGLSAGVEQFQWSKSYVATPTFLKASLRSFLKFQWSKSYVATPTAQEGFSFEEKKVSVIEILRSYSN